MHREIPPLLAALLLGLCACTASTPLVIPVDGTEVTPESRVVLPVGRSLLVRQAFEKQMGNGETEV